MTNINNEDAIIKENNLEENNINNETAEDDYDRVYGCEVGVPEEVELSGYNPYDYKMDIQSMFASGNTNTKDGIILSVTADIVIQYIKQHGAYDLTDIRREGAYISDRWLMLANSKIEQLNGGRTEATKLSYFRVLPAIVTAHLLIATGDFRACTDMEKRTVS